MILKLLFGGLVRFRCVAQAPGWTPPGTSTNYGTVSAPYLIYPPQITNLRLSTLFNHVKWLTRIFNTGYMTFSQGVVQPTYFEYWLWRTFRFRFTPHAPQSWAPPPGAVSWGSEEVSWVPAETDVYVEVNIHIKLTNRVYLSAGSGYFVIYNGGQQ
ncbi:MAG: hypothetical protein FJ276_23085 [Planctomycetes bacterium]|nr:hypothetical protein [Planctomycetota bacterium]